MATAFFLLTFQRNRAFANEESYYLDIINKAPHRAHMSTTV